MAGKRKSVEGKPEPKKSPRKSAKKSKQQENGVSSSPAPRSKSPAPAKRLAPDSYTSSVSPMLLNKATASQAASSTPSRVLFNTGDWYKSSAAAPSPKPSSSRSSRTEQQLSAASSSKKVADGSKSKGPSMHFKELEWIDYTFLAIVGLTLLFTFYFLATSVAFALKPAPLPPAARPSTSSYFAGTTKVAASASSSPAEAASSYATWLFESVGLLSPDTKGSTASASKDFWGNPATTKDSTSWATDLANSLYNSAFGTAATKK